LARQTIIIIFDLIIGKLKNNKGGKMRHIGKTLALFLVVFGITVLQAQESLNGSGGNATGSAGTSSYSIGQLFYNTNNGSGGSEAQGVQQPYEIYNTGIDKAKDISLVCSTYPVPASDILTLVVKNTDTGKLSYQLYDLKGNIIDQNNIVSDETHISMTSYTAGTYFLKIISQNTEVKTFKIIKK
jgi:hypothetical protein